MHDKFDEAQYSSLILYTTQQFGERSRISGWNDATTDRRVAILQEIHEEAEEREQQRQSKNNGNRQQIPDSLNFQRFVRNPTRQGKLRRVVAKFVIESQTPEMSTLYQRLINQYCKTILRGKCDDFLNALFGFVISPNTITSNSWEVTFEQFSQKVRELTPIYCFETRVFPRKHLGSVITTDPQQADHYNNRLFVQKIRDIEYHDVVAQAIHEYIGASRTVLEEFRHYEVSGTSHMEYAEEVINVFRPRYRAACRNVADIIKDSQTFFDNIIAEESPGFSGFERPPRAFRNGVLHMYIDKDDDDLKWRLG